MNNRKNLRGLTIIELLIVLSIIGIVIAGIIHGFQSCSSQSGSAETEARNYATQLGLSVKGVSCTDRDSDGDGYVSCSVSHVENGKLTIQPVECAIKWSTNSGCKAPKMVSTGVQ